MSGFAITELLDALKERHLRRPDVFIETGTYRGDRASEAYDVVAHVHTIERNPFLWLAAEERFRGSWGFHCHLGDSAMVLPLILPLFSQPNENPCVCFFLDAHWGPHDGMDYGSRELVLWSELRIIRRWIAQGGIGVVVVDDVHAFGTDRPTPEWRDVTPAALADAVGALSYCQLTDQLVLCP